VKATNHTTAIKSNYSQVQNNGARNIKYKIYKEKRHIPEEIKRVKYRAYNKIITTIIIIS
jgi:hypothetical protein